MAYTEKLGSIGDLMAMWQNRANREGSQPTGKQKMYQEEMMQAQLDAAKNANRMEDLKYGLLTSPFNIQNFGSSGMYPPGIGYEKYASDQKKDKMLSQITGQPLPNMGISGGGGGGGSGGGGEKGNGGANFEVSDGKGGVMVGSNLGSGQGYGYAGPDKSNKPNVVEAAGALGQIANQGQAPIEPTMADLLAQEQQNNAGYKSIINQKYANPSVETINRLMPNDNPVQAAIDKAASDKDLNFKAALAGGTKTGLSPQEIINLDIIKSKSENDQKVATQSEAIKKQREGEVRRLNLEQLKMNPAAMQIFSGPAAVEPEIQQAILDIGSSEQKKLFQYLPKMDSATKNKVLSTLPIAVAQNQAVNKRLDVDAFLKLLKISLK